jgi:guanine nucleotide-binding protein subunit alpha
MRLIHGIPFTAGEIEHYRQLVFSNLTHGIAGALDAADALELELSSQAEKDATMVENAPDVKDGQPFPPEFKGALFRLWAERAVQIAVERGNEFALPEKWVSLLALCARA